MVYGVPFPDIYDWTWGEVVEYILCADERKKDNLRIEASMLFNTATLIGTLFSGKGRRKISVMDSFGFLWSKKERQDAAREKRHASLMRKAKPKRAMTDDEQDKMLSELKAKILAEREKSKS